MALTYQKSGVNYHLMDAFKNACVRAGGNSPQILEFSDHYLIDINEGIGSLNQLADDIYQKSGKDFYYQVGWGNAATILNDLSMFGAVPLTLKLFVAAGSENWFADTKRWKNLIRGFKDGAKFAGASWNGGETQTLVGVINPKSIVLGGSATGVVSPKTNLISDKNIKEGDRIIIVESSGVHTNGITLIRKLFKNHLKILELAIKDKTIIYSPLIQKLQQQKISIHYCSHITGHGWRKIMRSKLNFSYLIDKLPRIHPIFKSIQQKSRMSDIQMYGDYNMGAGFILVVDPNSVDSILKIAKSLKYIALDAGVVKKGPRKVVIPPLGIEFLGKSLQIR
ncbi:hypothetical protein A3H85_00385 [Candidatus Daviesbacteria bacterium RIFCSPLOWO2_02_FULL_40_8]|uniref:Phosphoribosylformylglycinamidine cyclo-ligase n=1 Tax=Candidatus Daviesbacteria bacterium RIFCSPLOWO2_01_FULL_40_24 TaxID=1797787 RepID=A0A1F5MK62_9BACT|nr:MAG: hypothetical protein A2780_02050 [Candidatus Daviesbacteria bacterium RIFCSPHIGHO2_01_FULL_41_45]OGE65680.1 MAG: hypothetical protein A3B49_03900 [Candidatus Daviesbacteria bacterium RIFCSPLOWO2_01_FULL_40_24]OGE66067.1 MAG: hypothetical protein A3H85_00385 [Candidatus Daviesbacteria bacterium RIFCSPLOWO2_02_FULL_40_8]